MGQVVLPFDPISHGQVGLLQTACRQVSAGNDQPGHRLKFGVRGCPRRDWPLALMSKFADRTPRAVGGPFVGDPKPMR